MLKSNSGIARIAKSTTLPPDSETILSVKVWKKNSDEEVLLEPFNDELHSMHVLGSKCLVKVQNGRSFLRVLNPTNQSIRFCRGKVVPNVVDFDHNSCAVYNLDTTTKTNHMAH